MQDKRLNLRAVRGWVTDDKLKQLEASIFSIICSLNMFLDLITQAKSKYLSRKVNQVLSIHKVFITKTWD